MEWGALEDRKYIVHTQADQKTKTMTYADKKEGMEWMTLRSLAAKINFSRLLQFGKALFHKVESCIGFTVTTSYRSRLLADTKLSPFSTIFTI